MPTVLPALQATSTLGEHYSAHREKHQEFPGQSPSALPESLNVTPKLAAASNTSSTLASLLSGNTKPSLSRRSSGSDSSNKNEANPDDLSASTTYDNAKPCMPVRRSSGNFGTYLASPVTLEERLMAQDGTPLTLIFAGLVQKPYMVSSSLLAAASPQFFGKIEKDDQQHGTIRISGPFFFPDFDEYAFEIFVNWLHGKPVPLPESFHDLNHILCLHVLSRRFGIEALTNLTMDGTRQYYERHDMTSPAFRLAYIYSNTEGPCLMRKFLIYTAAMRALNDRDSGISQSIGNLLKRGGDFACDYAQAMVSLAKAEDLTCDPRKGHACAWHVHAHTKTCN